MVAVYSIYILRHTNIHSHTHACYSCSSIVLWLSSAHRKFIGADLERLLKGRGGKLLLPSTAVELIFRNRSRHRTLHHCLLSHRGKADFLHPENKTNCLPPHSRRGRNREKDLDQYLRSKQYYKTQIMIIYFTVILLWKIWFRSSRPSSSPSSPIIAPACEK